MPKKLIKIIAMDKKPIGFMSYSNLDDEHDNGNISNFRMRLRGEVRMQSGDASFDIFQDHIDIVWGQQWQQRLDDSLSSVRLLIPIITPSFFKSEACRREVERFVRREKQLGRDDLIFPVYYVTASVLEDKAKRQQDEIAQLIHRHQHQDWRKFRHKPLTEPGPRKMLAKMAQHIVAAMERGGNRITPEDMRESALQNGALHSIAAVPDMPPKPPWASATGIDAIGKWAEIAINNVIQRLRWVPPGHFLMGAPKSHAGRADDEWPQHRVTISHGLWMADTACTQAFWQAVMDENPAHFHEKNRGGPQHPVETVSWDMIQAFLHALQNNLPTCQVTLPTEAEWEYACRANSNTAFSFGEMINTGQVNFNGNRPLGKSDKGEYRERTLPVDGLPANAWGLYQMHGNVWEWCADGMRKYEDKAVADPGWPDAVEPPQNPGLRALRGGSWGSSALNTRSTWRSKGGPASRDSYIGFRFVLRHGS